MVAYFSWPSGHTIDKISKILAYALNQTYVGNIVTGDSALTAVRSCSGILTDSLSIGSGVGMTLVTFDLSRIGGSNGEAVLPQELGGEIAAQENRLDEAELKRSLCKVLNNLEMLGRSAISSEGDTRFVIDN